LSWLQLSWLCETESFLRANQEIPHLLQGLKVHYHIHNKLPSQRSCVTFCNKLIFYGGELLAPQPPIPSQRTNFCQPSATVYSIFLQLPSISSGHLFHAVVTAQVSTSTSALQQPLLYRLSAMYLCKLCYVMFLKLSHTLPVSHFYLMVHYHDHILVVL
jgi:hypothetical protein